jgi:hypothetical protein
VRVTKGYLNSLGVEYVFDGVANNEDLRRDRATESYYGVCGNFRYWWLSKR